METIFRRPELAKQMAERLLHPGVLDEGVRSGLFISGVRRIGKTTFLQYDLIPALESAGAIVIYVDLWTNVQTNPATLVHWAIRQALTDLASPASALWQKLKRHLKSLKIKAPGFDFDFDVDRVGSVDGVTLAQALTEVVDRARTDLVLIIEGLPDLRVLVPPGFPAADLCSSLRAGR